MNAKTVRSLAAAFVLTALAQPAMAESLGEHPAVLVARTWSSRGIDPNTYIILPPAYVHWVYALPRANDEATSELGTGSESAQVALTQASARPIRDPVMPSPMGGVSFDIGAERAVAYFLSDTGRCKLVLTQAGAAHGNANFTATRFEATIDAGKTTRYVSSDGHAIDFECQPNAQSVGIHAVAPTLADAR
jgi:hypothetical protein